MTETDAWMIDSNLLVYMFEDSQEFRHELAYKLLEKIIANEVNAAVSTQILSELFVNLTAERKKTVVVNPLDIVSAEAIIKDVIKSPHFTVLSVKPSTVVEAIYLKKSSSATYWDCLIAATMKENGITKIYTEDKDFWKIKGIEAVNPFQPT